MCFVGYTNVSSYYPLQDICCELRGQDLPFTDEEMRVMRWFKATLMVSANKIRFSCFLAGFFSVS